MLLKWMALVFPMCIHRFHFEMEFRCPVCIIKIRNWMPVEVFSHWHAMHCIFNTHAHGINIKFSLLNVFVFVENV